LEETNLVELFIPYFKGNKITIAKYS